MLSSAEVGDTIRQSLGMPAKPEPSPAVFTGRSRLRISVLVI